MIGSITFGNEQKISVSAVVYSHSDNLFVRSLFLSNEMNEQ